MHTDESISNVNFHFQTETTNGLQQISHTNPWPRIAFLLISISHLQLFVGTPKLHNQTRRQQTEIETTPVKMLMQLTSYRSSSWAYSRILSFSSRVGTSRIFTVCRSMIRPRSVNIVCGIIYQHTTAAAATIQNNTKHAARQLEYNKLLKTHKFTLCLPMLCSSC